MAGVNALLERFSCAAPIAVMARASLEYVLANDALEQIFEDNASRQYTRELAFSSAFWLMADVVTKAKPSLNSAFQAEKENLSVSVQSVYNKVNHTELNILEHLVSTTATNMGKVIDCWTSNPQSELIRGFSCRIIDGNVIAGTEHRIKELRTTRAAALPGRSVCFYNYQSRLIDDIVLDQNGHAQDRSQIDAVLTRVREGEVIIGDAGFCTQKMMAGIANRNAYFVLRKPSNTALTLIGKPNKVGTSDTGDIYEQRAVLQCKDGTELKVRLVTIKRFKPTSSGKMVVEILTNLPATVKAVNIAKAYRKRWTIENAFQDLGEVLATEINTMGYPSAALFGFTVGCVLQNMHSMIEHALRVAHKNKLESTQRLSRYKIALEIKTTTPGMKIAIESPVWERTFSQLTARDFSKWLIGLAKSTSIKEYLPYKWSPKGPPPKRKSGNRGNHIATEKILSERKSRA